MEQYSTVDLAFVVCRQLFEDTDGRSMEWRRLAGGHWETAVECGVDHGWLLFDDEDSSVCLTEEGRRLVRKTLS
jgi:hypothetical protein